MLVDKIMTARHPSKIDKAGATTSSAPSHTKILKQEAERLKAVHEARVEIVPRV